MTVFGIPGFRPPRAFDHESGYVISAAATQEIVTLENKQKRECNACLEGSGSGQVLSGSAAPKSPHATPPPGIPLNLMRGKKKERLLL